MKKLIICAIVACSLLSCSKSKEETKPVKGVYYFRAEAVSIDGNIDYSNIVPVNF